MKKFALFEKKELAALYRGVSAEYDEYISLGLNLDLSRGKPNASQLDISQGLLDQEMTRSDFFTERGEDCRNYGIVDGLPEMKKLFAELLEINSEDVIVGGNSSLQLMYDTLTRAMLFGVYGSTRPWSQEVGLKWLCVVPGYDRHFRITEVLGFELISVPMLDGGPDMEIVEALVKDPKVKGMWCVPKYSNPTGNTYSYETVERLASMKCAAPDFRIMWDNAYAVHDFDEDGDTLANIFELAEKFGNSDRIFYFSSTSKISFPGGGVAMMAASANNRHQIMPYLSASTIGYDKLNQIRHLKYFGDANGVRAHMMRLGGVIGDKFKLVNQGLRELRELGIAEWTEPRGGYFISLDLLPGTAKRVYRLMSDAGVVLTAVGATYPLGVDPEDKNLRIAPTYPADEDLKLALKVLVCSVKLAALEKMMEQ